jgi:molybdenum cofactor cytidylyltransferase
VSGDPGHGVHVALLAAGRSSRMGGPNKLLARFDGEPLVRLLALRALRSKARSVTVITGHQAESVAAALDGIPVALVHNPVYASGLATSIAAAVGAMPDGSAGALIMLGDMPGITTADLDRLIDAFEAAAGIAVRATVDGRPGNPVILPHGLYAEAAMLRGDTGARSILARGQVIDIELGCRAGLDVDTPEALAGAGGVVQD